jgi:ribA/ribD-fused uncharacterized protein
MTIDDFRGDYWFLSNFYHCEDIVIVLWGYPTMEHYFQAMKTLNKEQREKFKYGTPNNAKFMGRKVKLRPDWDQIRDEVMMAGLRRKFSIPFLRDKLLATGDEILIEGNGWHDNYWGQCNCLRCRHIAGRNKLGILLMQLRAELRGEGWPSE